MSIKTYTQSDLDAILAAHGNWRRGEDGGKRAYLQDAYLRGADLQDADLQDADLQRAYLRGANLQDADLQDANLRGANLRRANLLGADLQRANLQRADLRDAYLRDADLRDAYLRGADLQRANLLGANLQDADLRDAYLQRADLQDADLQRADLQRANLQRADLPSFQICPQEGEFVGWKKLRGNIVTRILVPAEAKRTSSLIGRKCRAEFAIPLDAGGKSLRDDQFLYVKDEIARCDEYDPDVRVECSGGIHFFVTKEEAEAWQ